MGGGKSGCGMGAGLDGATWGKVAHACIYESIKGIKKLRSWGEVGGVEGSLADAG